MKTNLTAKPDYLKFDEREDMICALEHVEGVAATLDETPMNWKWLLIAIHNALQGTLVCVLSGSHGTGALTRKSMKTIWDWYETPSDDAKTTYPKEWLAPPLELYERAKQENYMQQFGGSPIVTTHDQDDDVRQLNELRRGFAHYTPRLWSIECEGLPRIVLSTTAVIVSLLNHPALSCRLKGEQADRAHRTIGNIHKRFLTNEGEGCV